jgi:hypothetical protein
MTQIIARWVLLAVAAVVVGPVVGWLVGGAPSLNGGPATALVSDSPALGTIRSLLALVLAGGVGLVASLMAGRRTGIAVMGVALVWGAWGTARLDDLARVPEVGNPAASLGIEGFLLGLVAAAIAVGLAYMGRGPGREAIARDNPKAPAIGAGVFIASAIALAWVVARTGMVGQALAAAAVGGFVGGALARTFAQHGGMLGAILAVPLVAAIGPIVGSMATSGDLVEAVYEHSVAGVLRIMPMDWIAGLLVGLPLGWAQADTMIEHQTDKPGEAPHVPKRARIKRSAASTSAGAG